MVLCDREPDKMMVHYLTVIHCHGQWQWKMIRIGGQRQCNCLVSMLRLRSGCGGWVREGGSGEETSEDVQGSGWLRNHLPAIAISVTATAITP